MAEVVEAHRLPNRNWKWLKRRPEVIAAAVTEQPQVITESDVAVALGSRRTRSTVVEPQEETADIVEVADEVVVVEPEKLLLACRASRRCSRSGS